MQTFIASNGYGVERTSSGWLVVHPNSNGNRVVLNSGDVAAIREFFRHEASRKPWDDARAGDVWRFEVDGGSGQHALAWMSHQGTWDVLTPRGTSLNDVLDPIRALVRAGFPGFADANTTATKFEAVKEDPEGTP